MMDAQGKIYVVALVLALIFAGIAIYLFYLDNKLNRMEKKLDSLESDHQPKL
jgi:CcmD family protein